MGAHDFTLADVQKMSDAELTDIITNGKNKMPKYGQSLKPEEIKGTGGVYPHSEEIVPAGSAIKCRRLVQRGG